MWSQMTSAPKELNFDVPTCDHIPGQNGKLLVADFNNSAILDLVTGIWSTIRKLNYFHNYGVLTAIGSRIFAIGGGQQTFEMNTYIEEYNFSKESWITVKDVMMKAKTHFTAISVPAVIFNCQGTN